MHIHIVHMLTYSTRMLVERWTSYQAIFWIESFDTVLSLSYLSNQLIRFLTFQH